MQPDPMRRRDALAEATPLRHVAVEAASFAPHADAPGLDAEAWFVTDPAPVFLIGAEASLIEANPAAGRLLEQGSCVSLRSRRLVFADAQSNRSFLRALGELMARRTPKSWIVLRGNDGDWRTVDLLTCEGAAGRVFVSFRAEPQMEIDIEPLISAFGLTIAEGEVLRHLTEGLAPKEIARRLSVSTNTVRAHLRTLYLKMRVRGIPGVIRQSMRLTR